jgi:hypothetical protein
MESHDARMIVVESELLVLRGMCQGAPDGRVWQQALTLLAGYRFHDNLHQVVFSALRELNTDEPRILHELLGPHLTRCGFPDVDVEMFFVPHNLTCGVLLAMMRSLRGLARLPESPSPDG